MKKILLIVSSHEDAALLPKAAVAIGKLGCGLLWVWHSPILAIDPEKECSVIDAELRALEAGEKAARELRDYKTAEERKASMEKLQLNRSVEIRNAWKRVSEEERKKAVMHHMDQVAKVLNPNRDPKGVLIRFSAFPEHQDNDLWISALNEIKAHLNKDGFKGGEFAMMWPRQLVDADASTWGAIAARAAEPVDYTKSILKESALKKTLELPIPPIPAAAPDRKAELTGMRHFSLKAVAKKLNVAFDGRPKPEVITDILRAEELATM